MARVSEGPSRWSSLIGPALMMALALGTVLMVALGPTLTRGVPFSFLLMMLLITISSGSMVAGHPVAPAPRVVPLYMFLILFAVAAGWTAVAAGDGSPIAVVVCGLVAAALTPLMTRKFRRAQEPR